jgi:hypothetical protein
MRICSLYCDAFDSNADTDVYTDADEEEVQEWVV